MKTIIENLNNLSKYLLDDITVITLAPDNIIIGNPAQFIIGDMNSGNATVYNNIINPPTDWTGDKYFFDGTTWTQNPDWVSPTPPDAP